MAAYFVFNHKVLDPDTLNNDYLPKAVESLGPYDPEVLVLDSNAEVIEGATDQTRMIVLKFKSREEAKEWYNSPAYQACVGLRLQSVDGRALLCDEFDPDSA
ncbi:MAG: DUF1330 domain-containing protein [Rhodospirillales bacterium]|nr:DUF1330 domain-containing protein [Rhodospirillales bacterium]